MKRLLILLLSGLAIPAWAQNYATELKSTEVGPGVYMIEGVDGFIGGSVGLLVGEEYVVLLDDALPPISEVLQQHIETTVGRPVDFLVNTHYHGDHTGANALFAESGSVVFAHENIRKRLLEKPETAGGPGGLPVVTFGDGVTFHVDGNEAQVRHIANAHTDGDAIVIFPAHNIIFAGDISFRGIFPYIDLDGGGDIDGFIAAMDQIIAMSDEETAIIPGHGPLADRGGLMEDVAMLREGKARIQPMIDQGMSEDDIVAANPLADFHDQYNWGFITTERMTRTFYKGLSK